MVLDSRMMRDCTRSVPKIRASQATIKEPRWSRRAPWNGGKGDSVTTWYEYKPFRGIGNSHPRTMGVSLCAEMHIMGDAAARQLVRGSGIRGGRAELMCGNAQKPEACKHALMPKSRRISKVYARWKKTAAGRDISRFPASPSSAESGSS